MSFPQSPADTDLESLTAQSKLQIESLVFEGRLKPGERISEVRLSETLRLGRAPIRNALDLLASEGLLVRIARSGTFFMRKSKILSKLRKGEVARIACLYYPVTMFAAHAANAGYDGIWLDSEHNMWDPREIERMLYLHHLADIDCIVRTQFRESATGYQMLERGATGLMFPLVNTGEEARDIAGRTKFPPLGQRGLDAAGLDNRFYLNPPSEYVKDANEETVTVIQIETPEAVENVEEIAAAPGVDVLFIGWSDLALRIGCEINFKEPKMADAQKKVAAACQKNGINWGRPTGTPEDMTAMIEAGGAFYRHGQ